MQAQRFMFRPIRLLAAAAMATIPLLTVDPAAAQSQKQVAEHEITVTITRVKAIDAIDTFSRGDFFARVTIDGAVQSVPPVRQQSEITPNWTISKKVPPGRSTIKLEILDKDLTKDELIDINTLPDKRHQDFTINTRSCLISGFAGSPRCGTAIVRAGRERKSAEVTFTVTVKK